MFPVVDDIPKTDGFVRTPTCECPPIQTERHTINLLCMPLERPLVCPCVCIPQVDGFVQTSTCERTPIQTKR